MLEPNDLVRFDGLTEYAEIYVVIDPLDRGEEVEALERRIRANPAFTLDSVDEFDRLRLCHYLVSRPPECPE